MSIEIGGTEAGTSRLAKDENFYEADTQYDTDLLTSIVAVNPSVTQKIRTTNWGLLFVLILLGYFWADILDLVF
jgi:hypothetical protein